MPYLGNQHIVGDSVNNFKVLDDISSFTATFDGSASSVVSTANETIRVPKHRFVRGQRVTYNNGGGSNIGGLSSGTAYYVIYDTAHTIKLATSASDAASLTAINLNAVGGGTSHTLNAAFDGVNKKFRVTHGSGNRPRFHHATQLSIAINNVVQRPNNDANNFTEGYAVEIRDIIVFKTAPTVNDIFFGSLTGETRGTFDITNHKIDNYTGDGSTTLYNLSQNVPNNESLLVSLNGVIQHPTTQGTTRSYTLVSGTTNRLQFTTAPELGVEIQIRHLGFAGASSGDVSGFYGRTGNVGLTASDNITTGNINSSGIITATSFVGSGANLTGIDATSVKDSGGNVKIQAQASGAVYTGIHTFNSDIDVDGHTNLDNVNVAGVATFASAVNTGALTASSGTFSGNVSIGGTLTYEDVTNVDSVGVGTFRDGIKVGSGVTIEPNGQATFTGIVTFGSSSTTINGNTDTVNVGTALTLGHSQGLQYHTQNLHSAGFEVNQINATGVITATSFSGSGANLTGITQTTINNNAANKVIMGSNTANTLEAVAKSTLFGNLSHGQNFLDDNTLIFGDASDMQLLHTSSGAKSRLRNTNDSGSLDIESSLTRFLNKDGSTEKLRIDSSGRLLLGTTTEGVSTADDLTVANSSHGGITIRTGTSSLGNLYFSDGTSGDDEYRGVVQYDHSGDFMRFLTNATERFRIASNGAIGLSGTNYGSSGQVLTSQGSGSPVQWATPSAPFGGALDGMIFGGVETTYTSGGTTYKVHTFTSTGFLRVTAATTMDFLIVAGGGGSPQAEGYYGSSGGGGAGGMVEGSSISIPAGKHTLTVGAGGVATNQFTVGGTGGDSTFAYGGTTVTAKGGGGGADYAATGGTGGSGGGGAEPNTPAGSSNQSSQNSGISGISQYGNAGGQGGNYTGSNNGSGGGGGAGGAGNARSSGGGGGSGRANSITGSSVTYAQGGAGGSTGVHSGTAGTNGRGNGASGASAQGGEGSGAAGGSGIIIVRYVLS